MKRSELLALGAAGALAATAPTIVRGATGRIAHDPSKPITVAVVIGKGATVIDFAGPWEVFQDAMVRGPGPDDMTSLFQLAMVSDTLAAVEATDGMIVTPRYTYETIPHQPNVIVMGAQGEHTPAKIAWIQKNAPGADVVMSVCTGAFLLAQTGLLDGLSATTHHDFYDAFQQKFPKVNLVRGPRFVDNGKLMTAGGLTSGMELALHVVGRYYPDNIVAQTAYYMEYNRSPQRPIATTASSRM